MKKKTCRNIVLTIILFSTACNLADMTQINQNSGHKTPSGKSGSFKSNPSRYPLTSSWIPNGIAVCIESNIQDFSDICSDGEGGAIIVWEDNRTVKKYPMGGGFYIDSNLAVYAQRINSMGNIQWDIDGFAICTITNYYNTNPVICTDGEGGAIIAWMDNRSGNVDIYAQRVDADENPLWSSNGVPICLDNSDQMSPEIISDMQHGAIIAWSDFRNGNLDIYAQRVDSNGDRQWWLQGAAIDTSITNGGNMQLCSDGNGGAIIVWSEYKTGMNNLSIYSQRISTTGNLVWPSEVVIFNGTEFFTTRFKICSDDNEGAIIAWSDNSSGNEDVYSQRINSTGDFKWTENGKEVCVKPEDQCPAAICYDGFEGAIIILRESTLIDDGNIYAQRINSTGDLKWDLGGVIICDAIGEQEGPSVSNDGKGGAYIVWDDEKGGSYDVYAQYVNSSGSPQWSTNGIAICNENDRQQDNLIISDGSGGAIIAWNDNRKSNFDYEDDIYASEIGPTGIVITPKYVPIGVVSSDDDDDDKENEGEAILGYDIYLMMIAIFISVVAVHFALRKNFQK